METQNYASHRKMVPMYHYFATPLTLITLVASVVNLVKSYSGNQGVLGAWLIFLLALLLGFGFAFIRQFPLVAQDRAIRAEENLRHFVLTGKLLDAKLSVRQVVALRFAPDEEFVALAQKAAAENLKPNDIKKLIVNWKGDFYRA